MSKHIAALENQQDLTRPHQLNKLSKKMVFSILQKLNSGQLCIHHQGLLHKFGHQREVNHLTAAMKVHHANFFSDVLMKGSLGAAESYMKGHWSTDDLTNVVRLFVSNADVLNRRLDAGWSKLTEPVRKMVHALRKNTHRGSEKNIVAHYDLSNDFFRLFLDKTMAYSCGIFEKEDSSLSEASKNKFDRICKKLSLTKDDRVVEIGGGWGGFAIHAAENYGCHVTTTTISKNQYSYMKKLVTERGINDLVKVIKKDYRKLAGQYDKLVSIEMIEAVGHHYLDTFFECCCKLLKPAGMMALQAITIPDHEFDRHKRSVDFIKQYIFPGSCIPSVEAISKSVARRTDFNLVHFEDITLHYAKTLHLWRQRFFENIEKVKKMGFSESFIRMWDFYLSSCEGSFASKYNGDVQMIFTRPSCQIKPDLPPLQYNPPII